MQIVAWSPAGRAEYASFRSGLIEALGVLAQGGRRTRGVRGRLAASIGGNRTPNAEAARGARGTAVLEAEGVGALEVRPGRITSNFVVSSDGEVLDEQVVVLVIAKEKRCSDQ
jgi:hypothetical protein